MADKPEQTEETSEKAIEDLEVTDEQSENVSGGGSTAPKFSASSVLKAELNSTRK